MTGWCSHSAGSPRLTKPHVMASLNRPPLIVKPSKTGVNEVHWNVRWLQAAALSGTSLGQEKGEREFLKMGKTGGCFS